MASKSKAARAKQSKAESKINFYLIAIPVLAFVIKLFVMSSIQPPADPTIGGWLGADGENYLGGADGLREQGYFSDKSVLSYWPAGYPILIWLLSKLSLTHLIALISITQSIFYAYSSYFFVKQLRGTKLQPYMFLIGLALAFNPTLSLSSLAVGYESPIAACMLMVVGLIMKSLQSDQDLKFVLRITGVGFFCAFATFMQPRWILTSLGIAVLWALMYKKRKVQALILVGVVGLMSIAPAILIQRNQASIGKPIISTNLSAALKIGTGPETSGGYNRFGPPIPCNGSLEGGNPTDSEMLKCATIWYATNPLRTLELSWNKSVYFWSPWTGPIANGTMARNPWLKINPLVGIAESSQDGNDLVNGNFGKLVSWLWLAGGVFLMFYGYLSLRSKSLFERHLGNLSLLIVLSSWLACIFTIGDHRFRVPTMSMSLILQMIGIWRLKQKVSIK